MKAFHTFFDYWVGNKKSMIKSGRATSSWFRKSNTNESSSGNPPNVKDIITDQHKVHEFMNVLLGHHNLPEKITNLLLANGMRFFNKFMCFLERDPKGQYNTKEKLKSKHPYVRTVSTNDIFMVTF